MGSPDHLERSVDVDNLSCQFVLVGDTFELRLAIFMPAALPGAEHDGIMTA